MALKFRRGTTAQKSGSLAFGEPYVNTTIGALQIGLESSDITIRSVDSSSALVITSVSASSFISASSLKVTGDASINGNLTLGGNITIGDQTTDTVTVTANLSSSLIPSITNTFDLGSESKIWRDLYLSTGSIKLVNGAGQIVNTITNANIVTTDSISSGSVSLAASLPGGIISGSSQLTSSFDSRYVLETETGSLQISITNLNTFSGSQLTKDSTLETYTGSVETRFSTLATLTGSNSIRLTNLESTTASLNTSVNNINSFSGSQLTQNVSLATISGSLILTASANTQRLTAMEAVSGSWVTESETSSFARTNTSNTFQGNQAVTGNLVVTGSITANEFYTTYVTSSVMYNSGSNRFGDSADDLQQLIGIVEITGSIKGNQFNQLATITGSLISTASVNTISINNLNTFTGSQLTQNASLATISGSLITTASNHTQELLVLSSATSSYARINQSNTFGNSQIISGNVDVDGKITARYAVSASSVNINNSNGNSQLELVNSTTGRGFHLISYDGDSFSIHNPITGQSTFRIDSGSQYHSHFFGNVDVLSGSVSSSVGFSGSINGIGNVTAFSSSVVSQFSSLQTRATEIGVVSGSLITSASAAKTTNDSQDVSITNLNTFSGSQLTKDSTLATYTGSVETRFSTLGTLTGSNSIRLTNLESTSASVNISVSNLNTTTASLNISVSNLNSTTASLAQRISANEAVSSSYARTNSTNTFSGTQTISGSLFVTQDLIVQGSSSIQNISSSNLVIGTAYVTLNTNSPSSRYAGLIIVDSGSVGSSGSIVYDAVDDEVLFIHKGNGTNVTSSHFILGPETYDNLGNETYLTRNKIIKGGGYEHLADSQITDDGTTVSIAGNLDLTGSIKAPQLNTLATYTGSVESRFTTLATLTGSNSIRLTNLESATASLQIETSNLEAFTSSINTTIKSKLDADGVISGSSQLTTTFDARYLNTGGDSVVSGSSQIAFSGVTGTVSNAQLANSTISGISLGSNLATLTIGSGLSGTSYNGSTGVTITNSGVLSNVAGTGISVSAGTGNVTITNTGVTSLTAGTGVGVSAGTGAVTVSIGQAVATTSSPTFAGLTINGAITATGDITAYYTSDRRHKNNIQIIPNALQKVTKLNGVTWEWNDDVNEVTKSTPKTGLIAQEVQEVLPEVVTERQDGFLALDYSKMMGLLVEAIKEQQTQIHSLTLEIEKLKESKGL